MHAVPASLASRSGYPKLGIVPGKEAKLYSWLGANMLAFILISFNGGRVIMYTFLQDLCSLSVAMPTSSCL